jgi:hypothetical protein
MIERMIVEPDRAAHTVTVARDEPVRLRELIASLPEIARAIEEQDRLCSAAWRDGRWEEEPPDFAPQCDELIAQFARVGIRSSAYERVVREADKPLLRQARDLARQGDAVGRVALENQLRMKLPQYLENEQAIAAWLTSLDQARADVVQRHVYWAIDLAQSLHAGDVATTQAAATRAVEFAAKNYDYRRGYDFRTYAEHWVREYVGRAAAAAGEAPSGQ